MKDFDELLDEVLREDFAPEPSAGFEARVMARVRADAGHGSALSKRWRTWILGPAAACLGIVAVVWYVAGGGMPQPDRTASRASAPGISVEKSEIESSHSVAGANAGLDMGGSGRAKRDAHLSDDKTIAKMGHPVLENARYVDRKVKRVEAASEDEPKLETFPAVSQKGDLAGWLGGGDDGKLATIAREVTPAAAAAYQQLNAAQSEPIDIAAIEIKPLQ